MLKKKNDNIFINVTLPNLFLLKMKIFIKQLNKCLVFLLTKIIVKNTCCFMFFLCEKVFNKFLNFHQETNSVDKFLKTYQPNNY